MEMNVARDILVLLGAKAMVLNQIARVAFRKKKV